MDKKELYTEKQGGQRLRGVVAESKPGLPLVSIITVCYNAEKHLEQAMLSVLNQTYGNIEYILIDGNSKDSTLDIIRKYDSSVAYWLSEPDGGIYYAMNKGLELAKGELIAFKNADDWFLQNAVELAVEAWQRNNAAVIYGDTLKVWSEEPLQASLIVSDHNQLNIASRVDHRSSFTNLKWHKQFLFDTHFRIVADYKVNLQIKQAGGKFVRVNAPFSYMRTGGTSDNYKVFNELKLVQAEFFGGWQAKKVWFANISRFLIFKLKNLILQSVLGEGGYNRFKSRNAQ